MKLEVFDINGNALGRFVDLPSDVFGLELTKNHEHIVYLAVKQYLAHQRQGTHKTKERNEIAGSTRKLHKQKGTGGSRKGSIKNPLYRGGGRIFGPRPRNYELKLNKKVSRLARKAVLSSKVSDQKIIIIQDFNFDAPKTKNYLSILNSFNLGGKSLADLKSLLLINTPTLPVAPELPKYPYGFRGRKKSLQTVKFEEYNKECDNFETKLNQYQTSLVDFEDSLEKSYTNIALSCRNIPNADVVYTADVNTYQLLNSDCIILTESSISKLAEVLNK